MKDSRLEGTSFENWNEVFQECKAFWHSRDGKKIIKKNLLGEKWDQ